eukprot:gnl/TRDRNA2_/TRDRNA2_29280_c0_seq1.p1 gnl/TRDRNA2_/TRDRNA2_29280_c0~~gnl/TRDRNA2_/TRDRNA2_29280_c0_seq1.p1  ORF type:complete len:145 (-),score=27.66 gnl/TRDRNA2_/TRDRNA2_29280_c0_seq1:61-438(-)
MIQERDEDLIRAFIDSFQTAGGPRLKFDTFMEHYYLSWLLQGLAAVDLPRQIFLIGSEYVTPEKLPDIPTYRDPRIFAMPMYNNGMIAIAREFVHYWVQKDLPAFWARWRKANPAGSRSLEAKGK